MNAGAHAIGRAEFCHPDKHVDAQFLGPGQVDSAKKPEHGFGSGIDAVMAGAARPGRSIGCSTNAEAMDHGDENDDGRRCHQKGNQHFFEPVKNGHAPDNDVPSTRLTAP